jgi:hypothetical protein
VPAVVVAHELKQYLPTPFIRYSAALMVGRWGFSWTVS